LQQQAGDFYTLRIEHFDFPWFEEVVTPTLKLVKPGALNYTFQKDFQNMRFGGNGAVQGEHGKTMMKNTNKTKSLFHLLSADVIPVGDGCTAESFANFRSGAIALIDRAFLKPCVIETKINNSIAFNASAVLMYYDASADGLFSGGLSYTPPIPVSKFGKQIVAMDCRIISLFLC
jgi:hypothetical protein